MLAHWEAAARWLATNPRSKAASVFDVASGESATVLDLAQRVVAAWSRLHPDRPVPRVEIVENPRGAIEILHPEFEVSRAETERVLRVRCAHSLDESLDSILRGENMLTGLSDRRPG
ncbi:MAG TPA: hypothetical protein VEY07_04760 [Thermoplasmata archaeon]|nr:hypothetical protein [Thermoplasmata archaeon]